MSEQTNGPQVMEEPTAFLDVGSGIVTETYALAGEDFVWHIAGGEDGDLTRFSEFTLILQWAGEHDLQHVAVEVADLPVPELRRIGTVTGLPDMEGLTDGDTVVARFDMSNEGALALLVDSLAAGEAFEDFLDTADEQGMPVLFDFGNYTVSEVLSG